MASLLSYTLWHALTFPITYLLLFVLVASALLQIRYVNRALQRFDSTQVIPTQFVLFTISVIIGSAVLYRDFESTTADRLGKFVGGCVLTFLGVYLITSGRAGQHGDDKEEEEDEESTMGLVDEERYQDELEAGKVSKASSRRESTPSVRLDHHSRRSSRPQADGPSSLPRTPQRLQSTASVMPSTPFMSETEDPNSPLLENPWQSSREQLTRPRQLESTISTPTLPTQAQTGGEPSSTPDRPPMSPRRSDRPANFSRNSVARIMPGPLISPLSSPLSAIVADSLRRGVDPREARRRPGLSALRKSNSQRSTGDTAGTSDAEVESSPLRGMQRPGMAVNADSPTAKGRSFSVSLGEFFRLKRDRSSGSGEGGGEGRDEADQGGGCS